MTKLDPVLTGGKKRKPLSKNARIEIARGQKWLCKHCHEHMEMDDFDIHHKDGKNFNNDKRNLVAVHVKCHRKITRKMKETNSQKSFNIDMNTRWI